MCGEAIVDQYTRIVGYLTPVSSWNSGRTKEHAKRVFKKAISSEQLLINEKNQLPQRKTSTL
jgi:hypothetical protein